MKQFLTTMKQILTTLKGKKTYILSVLLALYGLLKAFEILNLTQEQEISVYTFLGSLLAISIRDAINNK